MQVRCGVVVGLIYRGSKANFVGADVYPDIIQPLRQKSELSKVKVPKKQLIEIETRRDEEKVSMYV